MKIKDIILMLALCAIECVCLIPLGPDNPYYPIESYNGSREQEYWVAENILNDDPVDLTWYQNICPDLNGVLWIADAKNNVIGSLLSNYGVLNIVAGGLGVQDFRNGAFQNARFNAPSALAVFTYDTAKAYAEFNKKVVIVNSGPSCQYVSYSNYTSCVATNDTNSTATVDPNQVFILYPTTEEIVSTYAGQCGEAGFADGPPQENMINETVAIGVDALGNVFLYDSNNSFVRMIDSTGTMYTLVIGACRNLSGISPGQWGTQVRCYRNWVETSGTQIWTEPSALDRCFLQEVLCVNSTDASPINYQNQTLREIVTENATNSSSSSSSGTT